MSAQRYRRKPVQIEAMQWTGDNEPALRVFTGGQFEALEFCDDDADATAAVRESVHGTWRLLHTGDYVTKTGGFLDKATAQELAAEYEPVDA